MRQELIFRGSFSTGDVKFHTIGKGHLNGLLFYSSDTDPGYTVTIKRRTEHGTHVLCANMKAKDIQAISHLEGGVDEGSSRATEALGSQLVTKAVITQAEYDIVRAISGDQGMHAVHLDLGSLYLGRQSELEITVNFSNFEVGRVFAAYAVSVAKEPDQMYQYDVTADLEATHNNVDAVFLTSADGTNLIEVAADGTGALISPDLTLQLEDSDSAWLTDILGLFVSTNVLAGIEGAASSRIFQLYRRPDALPAEVFVKLMGTDTNKVRLIVRRSKFDQRITSDQTVEELTKLRQRVEKIEREQPELAKALRHAGAAVKSEQLEQVEKAAKATNAADAAAKK